MLWRATTRRCYATIRSPAHGYSGTWREALMVRPTHFDVKYSINPYMRVDVKVDRERAIEQWTRLKELIEAEGRKVHVIEQDASLPDQVFVSNAALTKGFHAYLGNFVHEERRREIDFVKKWFLSNGYIVHGDNNEGFFAGNGDCIYANVDTLFAGFGKRSERHVYDTIRKCLKARNVVECALIDDRFYDLDTAFAALNDEHALYLPQAFEERCLPEMKRHINLHAIDFKEACTFACNLLPIGDLMLCVDGNERTMEIIARLGFRVQSVDVSEFLKAGGAVHCLVQPLYL